MKELIELFEARRRAMDVPYAVATVLRVEGSSYRRPGARMLISVNGRVAGSVSGGCLEKAVIGQGQQALFDGKARLLSFDTTDQDDLAYGSSLGCQGKIWIGVEVLAAGKVWSLEKIVETVRRRREPAAIITEIGGSAESVTCESNAVFEDTVPDDESLSASLRGDVAEVLGTRKTRFVGAETVGSHLIEWLGPPVALLLLGGGLDVPPMVNLASALGHEVTVIDRRPEFTAPENFPGAHRVITAKPHQIAAHLRPDSRMAAVIMNHHYDTDRDVLAALLPLGLPYIAMLGPKLRTERILAELIAEGHDVSMVESALHGPAGLDIGAETPEQIALAILAEIQATLAGRDGAKLRRRNAPIHGDSFTGKELSCPVPA
jgi:xanthine dehydrogenase accessory factor